MASQTEPILDVVLASRSVMKVESADGELFILDVDDVNSSGWLKMKHQSLDPKLVVKLEHGITANTFRKVLEFVRFHRNASGLSGKDLKQWDQDFVKADAKALCELAAAAYYLDIKPLVDLSCRAIASVISGKSAEEIRQTFNIHNDFNEEEEANLPKGRKGSKIMCVKKRPKNTNEPPPPKKEEDHRSVDDLLAFIEGKGGKQKASQDTSVSNQRKSKKRSPKKGSAGADREPSLVSSVSSDDLSSPFGAAQGSGVGESRQNILEMLLSGGDVLSLLGTSPTREEDAAMDDDEVDKEVEEFAARLAAAPTAAPQRSFTRPLSKTSPLDAVRRLVLSG